MKDKPQLPDSSTNAAFTSRRPLGRRVVKHVLGVAVVVACIFTALQIREFFLLRSMGSPSWTGSATSGSAGAVDDGGSDDDSSPANPLALRHTAERAGAMERYTGDPAGLTPPAGASSADGWQQRSYGATRQQRTYRCPQQLDDVAAHYRRQATENGLSPVGELSGPGTLLLQWTAPGLHVTANLRQESARQTRAVVTASHAE